MIDFTLMLGPMFSVLWYLIPLAILAAILKSPWFKGVAGETLVNLAAKLFLDGKDYHLIRNVTLPTAGGTTQIDHIIVSRYGVFVIETKNMSGWIFGSPHQKTWTQKIFRETHKFQNPLHQNYKHTQTLEAMLGIDPKAIFSVIVFVGGSSFKTAMPENVTESGGYLRYIKSKREVLLCESEVARITQVITSGRLTPSLKTHRTHVQNLRSIHEIKTLEASRACPKCGKPMVLREARKGSNAGNKFWGCSGFPQCKGTSPV
jgi:restriction system protein